MRTGFPAVDIPAGKGYRPQDTLNSNGFRQRGELQENTVYEILA